MSKRGLIVIKLHLRTIFAFAGSAVILGVMSGCGAQPGTTSVNLANTNSNISNSRTTTTTNANSTTSGDASSPVNAKEPEQYEAKVTLNLEATGNQEKMALPTLSATVSRNANDRRMEFTMPAGGRVVFLDKGGTNYLILPDKKQYAELTSESLGFEIRRMMMPEQIVAQAMKVPGMQLVGEEKYQGRDAVKYRYAAVANTGTQAGQVSTDSFLLVDKETGLPLHSETVSQTQSGANVQGFNGVRVITEIANIRTDPLPEQFEMPTGLQKIDTTQVREQVDTVFNTLALFLTQIMKQGQTAPSSTVSPAR